MQPTSPWSPPEGWRRITTIDVHAAGEPLRVITGGFPEPPGATILERRRWCREHVDRLRTALMWEPRGHADMYGAVVTPPHSEGADLGVLFLHNEGYSTMCGHGVIGLATVAVQTGMVPVQEPETRIAIDTPAGQVVAWARTEGGSVTSVRFRNVRSFVAELGARVWVAGVGNVRYDLAFGGAFYAFVEAAAVGLSCEPRCYRRLIELGMAIKRAVVASRSIEHPFEKELAFLYGTIFVGPPHDASHHSRNVCVFAEGEVDRSPTGTGVSARAAILHARGELETGRSITIESILGTTFDVQVVEEARFGPYAAVVPEVTGQAWITGRHEFLVDPSDPLRAGFLLR